MRDIFVDFATEMAAKSPTMTFAVSFFEPQAFVASTMTLKVPAFGQFTEGGTFPSKVAGVPFSKVHLYVVGEPPSTAVNKRGVAAFPAQKDVIGAIFTEGAAIIVTEVVHVFEPQGFVIVKVTTNVPVCEKMIVGFVAFGEGAKVVLPDGETDHALVTAPTD